MNASSFESLTQLLTSNTSVELPPENKVSTKSNPDKNAIWDDDEIEQVVETDPRPSPEYFIFYLTKDMI